MANWRKRAGAAMIAAMTASVAAGCAQEPARQGASASVAAALSSIAAPIIHSEPDWRLYFKSLSRGGIIVSIDDRRLYYWAPKGDEFLSFPIAVPRSPEMSRLGATRIVRKREQPDWRPTPAMIRRMPELPKYIGPGPNNPMGEHAMYLSWRYYAIHGTNNRASIGQQATSGCIRLYPEDIATLFSKARVGTPVRVVQRLKDETAADLVAQAVAESRQSGVVLASISVLGRNLVGALNVDEAR